MWGRVEDRLVCEERYKRFAVEGRRDGGFEMGSVMRGFEGDVVLDKFKPGLEGHGLLQ